MRVVVADDNRMPPTHTEEGLRAAQEIRARHPEELTGALEQLPFVTPE